MFSASSTRNPAPSTSASTSTSTATTSQHLSASSAAAAGRPLHSHSTNTSVSAPNHAPLPGPGLNAPQQQQQQQQQQLHQTLPSEDQQRHIAEARDAVVASIGNMLDGELQTRARMLHANAAALDKQERDVVKATDALRKENDKLARLAGDAARRVKELGNVQNWAEVLERDFLVLEETFSWSGSDVGDGDEDGDVRMRDDGQGKGKEKEVQDGGKTLEAMELGGSHEDCSEASQSVTETGSSNGTEGRAKGSETTSISTL
ncbi:hypothetical protein Cob_v001564 [Colletotrichum orbiculare MAFF 240422]|uniref:Biogenesis of lysosome-related organelles complex 1 subunit 1 n=1 Tax=Colletotrichum orbiculare (strain 104-T / ATCC 96160 / CBS 514.97 / LARS 414 / MAFF 240422) TaxID=1213857 RepID=A0A484G3W2_COLOR|nr:hypothetical protein Cob_v001564 [Colletotrichum orbiculare MAFF 240422]